MIDLPGVPGGYPCILADPAWSHVSRSPKGQTRRSPSHHYPVMTLDEIKALPVRAVAAKNAHLFLWTTWPHLPQALEVMQAWGFAYSSGFLTWIKLNPRAADQMWMTDASFHVGMGYTSRKNSELLILGRRGAPKRLSKAVRELMIAGRRQHSRKPDETFRRIEAYCSGPRLEMFAREARPGWTAWGNDTGRFDRPRVHSAPPSAAIDLPVMPAPSTPMFPAEAA